MIREYRVGISTTVDYTIDIQKQLELISKAGFDFVSIGGKLEHSYFLDRRRFYDIIETAKYHKIFIESAHAPFGKEYDIASIDANIRVLAIDRLNEFLHHAGVYGIPIVIIHPHHYFSDSKEACFERASKSLEQILSSKSKEVVMAIENLPTPEGSRICSQLLESFGGSKVGFCYDSSHENMSGEPFHLLKKYYGRLTTCHLSDNHGLSDEHLVPGDGNINWQELRLFFDKAPQIQNILFEVGTGEKLAEPVEMFIERTAERARVIFSRA